MTGVEGGLRLTPHEALARDLIIERCSAPLCANRASSSGLTRAPRRAALLLRSLADRLDHRPDHGPDLDLDLDLGLGLGLETLLAPRVESSPTAAELGAAAPAHPGAPRPWSPVSRRASHRHT